MKERKRDIRIDNSNKALLLQTSQHNHNIDFNSAKMLTYIHNKNLRRIFEAAAIYIYMCVCVCVCACVCV